MPSVLRIVGGAGTGKTHRLMELMQKALEVGEYTPFDIGFSTFTRAARQEASTRAAGLHGIKPSDLEQDGWFRTVHSICYRQLRIGKELLTDDKASLEWIETALGEGVSGIRDDDAWYQTNTAKTDADVALSIWSTARSRLAPFNDVWKEIDRCAGPTAWIPDVKRCRAIVEKYEQMKRLDHRCDFTDILGRFAGIQFGLDDHARNFAPEGEIPCIPVWFIDEAQDCSALIHAVYQRLTSNSRWVYVCGDPFQSVYSFAGSDSRHFMEGWGDAKQIILDQSYRCPAEILALGERTLKDCSNYWDRGIRPAEHAGGIDRVFWGDSSWLDELDPRESWLLIARTNFQASRLQRRLNGSNIPWLPTNGVGGKWAAPQRMTAQTALRDLANGSVVRPDEWKAILKQVSAKDVFARGTKTLWSEKTPVDKDDLADLTTIAAWGATERFVEDMRNGRWKYWIDGTTDYLEAVDLWGWEAVHQSKIQVGTIHSVKGAEADNVLLLTSTSEIVHRGSEDDAGRDEELRIAYVGVTRARKNLLICDEPTQYRMEVA